MKKYSQNPRVMRVKNNKGVALVVILMVFVVTIILGTSAVSMVYSDNMFSQHQKEEKKAYYAARSAVSVVEQAIIDEINKQEAQWQIVDESTGPALEIAMSDYVIMTKRLMGDGANITVLPNEIKDKVKHKVVLATNEFDIDEESDEIIVEVTFRPTDDTYLIEAAATVNGTKAKASRVLDLENKQVEKVISQAAITFDNALYAHEYIDSKTSAGKAITTVNGTASWGYGHPAPNLTYGSTGIGSTITQDKYGERALDQSPELVSPEEMFVRVGGSTGMTSKVLPTPTKVNGKPLYQLTNANSGQYLFLDLDGTYDVDTTDGDVILHVLDADFSNNVTFNIKSGSNDLIIYLEDSIGDGNTLGFNGRSYVNGGSLEHSDILLILGYKIDKFAQNNIEGKYFYIYAPDSDLEIDNNIGKKNDDDGFIGAIIANSIYVGNGGTITYAAPNPKILDNMGDMFASGSAITLKFNKITLDTESYWLK